MQKNLRRDQRRQKVSHPSHGQHRRRDLHGLGQCVRHHKSSLQWSVMSGRMSSVRRGGNPESRAAAELFRELVVWHRSIQLAIIGFDHRTLVTDHCFTRTAMPQSDPGWPPSTPDKSQRAGQLRRKLQIQRAPRSSKAWPAIRSAENRRSM
jgi:hypothetical protein